MKTNFVSKILTAYIFIATLVAFYIYGIEIEPNGDNIEHLNASWLIWQGFVPYRDFFQHHNPLLWYIFSPLVACLINNYNIFAIFNIISIIAYIGIIISQCNILLHNKLNNNAVLFFAAILISSYSTLLATDYRPDTFMYLFIFMGLLYQFKYRENPQIYTLCLCFVFYFIGFMFTQKAIFCFVIPAFAVLYDIIKKQMKLNHVFYALITPIMLGLFFISYLYYTDALGVYFKSNFYFNTKIPEIFYETRTSFPPFEYFEIYLFIPLGAIASAYFLLNKGTFIEKIFSCIYIEEAILRIFYFSAFLHYIVFWLFVSIILTVMLFSKFTKAYKYATILGLSYLFIMLAYNLHMAYVREIEESKYIKGHKLAFDVLNPCDYAINGYYSVYNLKAKPLGYYSILLGQIDVLGEKMGIAKKDNINKLIQQKLPKLISGEIYWDTYWEQRGKRIPVHIPDKNIVKRYYNASPVGNLFVLKPEYQKHKCIYDGKEWRYID